MAAAARPAKRSSIMLSDMQNVDQGLHMHNTQTHVSVGDVSCLMGHLQQPSKAAAPMYMDGSVYPWTEGTLNAGNARGNRGFYEAQGMIVQGMTPTVGLLCVIIPLSFKCYHQSAHPCTKDRPPTHKCLATQSQQICHSKACCAYFLMFPSALYSCSSCSSHLPFSSFLFT